LAASDASATTTTSPPSGRPLRNGVGCVGEAGVVSDEAIEAEKEEDNWTVVLGSAHRRRKTLG
jgi:hypothetical protein